MNELSRLIYWADVSGRTGNAIIAFVVIVALVGGVTTIVGFTAAESYSTDSANVPKWRKLGFRALFLTPTLMVALIVAAVLAPSRDAMYAIAASQMGERLIATPTANKAVRALDAWLDRQIAPPAAVSP